MGKINKVYHKINQQIKSSEVRVIGDDFENSGEVFTIQEALNIADSMNVDLVEITSTCIPVVCKLIDYNKYLYELKKKEKEKNKKQKECAQEIKELRFRPHTDEHDFIFKLNHAKSFLERGDIVKAFVFFKGREISFKNQGEKLLRRLVEECADFGTPDNLFFKLEGNKMIIMIKPKKK